MNAARISKYPKKASRAHNEPYVAVRASSQLKVLMREISSRMIFPAYD
ncbi:hypothetical protein GLA29479_412 [Lysobacter antibioticus]|uniref:Uncharacterized protein n=1 Tax=Lysobacter antibioticus TaxID=84531 RepID=A0A0S2FI22_LYSAN|nr:hypothetical protein GLA29479_412 [Lysobacter antibioticus]ALN83143.1 hypothetical protein LA76x_5041 [Lysobacter antibioticus]